MYYLYQHRKLSDNSIFYIGISRHNKQFKYKRARATDARNNLWKKIFNKHGFKHEILIESDDLTFIKNKEIELIALYGKICDKTGILANLTDGGEGTFGYHHTFENKLKSSLRMKERKVTEETRFKMSQAQLGKIVPKEVGMKISLAKKGKNLGVTSQNKSIKILHIPTNTEFKSISQASKFFKLRRCTLSLKMKLGLEKDFIYI